MNRILFVTESLFPLGPAQQLTYLARKLVERNLEVHIAVLSCRPAELDRWNVSQIAVHALGEPCVDHPFSRASFQAIHRLQSLLQHLTPDLVHSWCGMAELITLAATQLGSLRRSNPPLRRIATELYLQPEKRLTRQFYENRISHGFDRIAVPHASIKQHLVKEGHEAERIFIIPNTVEFQEKNRSQCREWILSTLKLPANSKLAGTVAPLVPRSRLKDLVWACDLLRVNRDDIHLLVIGAGSQLPRLKRFAAMTEAGPHCHFLGQHPQSEEIMAGIDFYWHSHLNEPLPGNLLSAMSNGIPAIAVYGPGTSEIIRHQETGFAVNFGARDELARWTRYLLELPLPAEKLSSQGQAYVRQKLVNPCFVDQYLKLYSLD